jgi:cyclopropane fatty-acyl-phospholipid synthase-like methyltransferase
MAWFKHWFGTPWYALLYGHRDELEAKAWVDCILDRWALPPGSRVLDLACGRGRHVRWMQEAGMQATGVDISEESIDHARRSVPGA